MNEKTKANPKKSSKNLKINEKNIRAFNKEIEDLKQIRALSALLSSSKQETKELDLRNYYSF